MTAPEQVSAYEEKQHMGQNKHMQLDILRQCPAICPVQSILNVLVNFPRKGDLVPELY